MSVKEKNEMLSYAASISEKIGCITVTENLKAKPYLRKNNRIKSIHSSLKIEANSLSLGQVRDIINAKYLEDEAGTFRRGEEGVFNGDRCIEQRNKIMFEIYY